MLAAALGKTFETDQLITVFKKRTKAGYLEFLGERWNAIFNTLVIPNDIQVIAMLVEEIVNHDLLSVKTQKTEQIQSILLAFKHEFSNDPISLKCYSAFLKLANTFTTKANPYKNLTHLGKKQSWAPAVHEMILNLSSQLSPIQKQIEIQNPGPIPGEVDGLWYDLFNIFIKLYDRVKENYLNIKNEQGVLDFEDLQILTLYLLRKNDAIRKKLHERFRYIMVDEFQDTNPVQWEIVELLIQEGEHFAKDQAFVVGDPKQSIYGFREADIRIFKNVVNQFARESGNAVDVYAGNIVFHESFRFLPQINFFINHFFSQILFDEIGRASCRERV